MTRNLICKKKENKMESKKKYKNKSGKTIFYYSLKGYPYEIFSLTIKSGNVYKRICQIDIFLN